MERGAIPLSALPGGLDLTATLESGQSYCWRRSDGGMYRAPPGDTWYWTVVDGAAGWPQAAGDAGGTDATGTPGDRPRSGYEVVRVRQADGALEWESTTDAVPLLRRLLRLDDDLPAIRAAGPDDPLVTAAYDAYPGLRLVADPPFRTLVSFICSAQMRVERIHEMQVALAREFGEAVEADGETYRAFPTPERLAAATEADLRELGLGYRAPYVVETAEMVAAGERHPADVVDRPYEEARAALTEFVGVGRKVADCVLLFSLGYLQAVPLDTWIRSAIADHFPDCDGGSYDATSRAIRERLGVAPDGPGPELRERLGPAADGSPHVPALRADRPAPTSERPSPERPDDAGPGAFAGYAQTYVFHHLRTGE